MRAEAYGVHINMEQLKGLIQQELVKDAVADAIIIDSPGVGSAATTTTATTTTTTTPRLHGAWSGAARLFLLGFFVLAVLVATMVEIVYNFTDSQPCVSSASYHSTEGSPTWLHRWRSWCATPCCWSSSPTQPRCGACWLRMVRTSPLYLLVAYFVFYGYQLYANFPTDHMTRGIWAVVYVLALAANLTALLLTMGWNYVRKGSISRIHQGLVVSLIMIQMLGKIILTAFYEVSAPTFPVV